MDECNSLPRNEVVMYNKKSLREAERGRGWWVGGIVLGFSDLNFFFLHFSIFLL